MKRTCYCSKNAAFGAIIFRPFVIVVGIKLHFGLGRNLSLLLRRTDAFHLQKNGVCYTAHPFTNMQIWKQNQLWIRLLGFGCSPIRVQKTGRNYQGREAQRRRNTFAHKSSGCFKIKKRIVKHFKKCQAAIKDDIFCRECFGWNSKLHALH